MDQNSKFFREILENNEELYTVISTEGIIEYQNPVCERVVGYECEELKSKNFFDFVSQNDLPLLTNHISHILREGTSPTPIDFSFRHKNGNWIILEAIVKNLTKNSLVSGLLITARDVTERKVADEVKLAESEERFQSMKGSLEERNRIVEDDLKAAQIIQTAFLPDEIPSYPNLKVDYIYLPLDFIGGDYFSLYPLREGGYGIFIGDVANHGITAAIFFSLLKFISDKICRRFPLEPKKFIDQLNLNLKNYMPHSFLTALYGFFHYNEQEKKMNFTFSRGGHPLPIVYEARSKKATFVQCGGRVIGEFDDINAKEVKIELNRGDRLFLYTDGIPEAMNESDRCFGFDPMLDLIKKCHQKDLRKTLYQVIRKINEFRGRNPLSDDIILIGVEVQ